MVYVTFYKSTFGEWDDKIIDKVTGGLGYSHCEILTSTNKSIGAHYKDGGVIECEYNDILDDPRWDVYVLDIDPDKVMKYLIGALGDPYDLKGVLITALTPFKKDNKGSKWCSELCSKALNEELKDQFNPLSMPNELARKIIVHPKSTYLSNRKLDGSLVDWLFNTRDELDRYGRVKIDKTKIVERHEREMLVK